MVLITEPRGTHADPELVVATAHGAVSEIQVARSRRVIGQVLRCHHIAGTARVRLSAPLSADAPMLVQVNVRLPSGSVRVQATGPVGFAVTFTAERLDRKLAGMTEGPARQAWLDPGRSALSQVTQERPIVRRKEYRLLDTTAARATVMLHAMDYDALLYVDARTGADAVVYRADRKDNRNTIQPTVIPPPNLRLDETAATARLCEYGLPVLFFTDPHCERGRLLYRRYDGNLAIILPA